MKITKVLAKNIARELVKKREKGEKELYKIYSNLVYNSVLKTIPKEILTLSKKHPEYFSFYETTRLKYNEQDKCIYEYFNFNTKLPLLDRNYYITIPKEEYYQIVEEKKKLKVYNEETEKQRKELITALLQLGTKARVLKEFPELEKYFPGTTTALVPNMDNIRDIMKNLL